MGNVYFVVKEGVKDLNVTCCLKTGPKDEPTDYFGTYWIFLFYLFLLECKSCLFCLREFQRATMCGSVTSLLISGRCDQGNCMVCAKCL